MNPYEPQQRIMPWNKRFLGDFERPKYIPYDCTPEEIMDHSDKVLELLPTIFEGEKSLSKLEIISGFKTLDHPDMEMPIMRTVIEYLEYTGILFKSEETAYYQLIR